MTLEMRVLGELKVLEHGRRVRLATRKENALLVYLAAHQGRRLSRERVGTLLWADATERRARHSLSQALYGLCKRLPSLVVERSGDDVWLPDGAVGLDLLDFQAAVAGQRHREAEAIFAGSFLEDFWVSGADGFEEWQESVRGEVDRGALTSFSALLDELEGGGDWPEVQRIANRILRLDPYNERACQGIIRSLAATGNQQAAISEYKRFEALFETELGRTPSGETTAIIDRLGSRASTGVAIADEPATGDGLFPLIGRGSEFRILKSEWRKAREGGCRIVSVYGEAGIGKTHLCSHFLTDAGLDGGRVLRGACYASEARLSYSGVVDALASGVRVEDLADIPAVWAAAVCELLPEFAPPELDRTVLPPLAGEGGRRRLFEAVARLVEHIAEPGGVVLFVDDLHWADESTCALLHYIARRCRESRLLVLTTVRPEDVGPEAAVRRLALGTSGLVPTRRLRLGPLGPDAICRLIDVFEERRGHKLPEPTRRRTADLSAGRPFFLLEALRGIGEGLETDGFDADALRQWLPVSVQAFLEDRFAGLSRSAQAVLRGLAVLGEVSNSEPLRRVAGQNEDAFLTAIEELSARGIIKDTDEIRFSHDLLREAAYRSIGAVRRRSLHQQAADILADRGAAPGILAVHYQQSGDASAAHRHAMRAADESERAHAHDDTERYLQLALTTATTEEAKLEALRRLSDVLFRTRRFGRAEPLLLQLESALVEQDAPFSARLDVRLKLAEISYAERRGLDTLVSGLEKLRGAAEASGEPTLAYAVARLTANSAFLTGRIELAEIGVRRLLDLARKHPGTAVGVDALRVASVVNASWFDVRRSMRWAVRATKWAEGLNDPELLILALLARGRTERENGRLTTAFETIETALGLIDRVGAIANRLRALVDFALTLLEQGRYRQAEQSLREALELSGHIDSPDEHAMAYANLALIAWKQGDPEASREYAFKLLPPAAPARFWWAELIAFTKLGLTALDARDLREAERCSPVVEKVLDEQNLRGIDVSYAEIFLARLEHARGELDGALTRLSRAIVATRNNNVLCRTRLQLEWSRLLSECDPANARDEAKRLRRRAARMGAQPLVEKADRVLELAGARLRRAKRRGERGRISRRP